jgi:AcrR family transcriptional regulator
VSDGYTPTTIEAVARRAAVAVPTVYAVFASKAGILSALVASAGADLDIRAAARRAMAQRDPGRRLAAAAHVVRMILERERDLTDVLWQAGSGDSQLRSAWRQSHQQQLGRMAEVIAPIARAGQLKAGVSVRNAVDIFWALGSPEMYRLLVMERGWSAARYEKWYASSAKALLLG